MSCPVLSCPVLSCPGAVLCYAVLSCPVPSCLYVCPCVCICMYVYVYVCLCLYACMYVFLNVFLNVSLYGQIPTCFLYIWKIWACVCVSQQVIVLSLSVARKWPKARRTHFQHGYSLEGLQPVKVTKRMLLMLCWVYYHQLFYKYNII